MAESKIQFRRTWFSRLYSCWKASLWAFCIGFCLFIVVFIQLYMTGNDHDVARLKAERTEIIQGMESGSLASRLDAASRYASTFWKLWDEQVAGKNVGRAGAQEMFRHLSDLTNKAASEEDRQVVLTAWAGMPGQAPERLQTIVVEALQSNNQELIKAAIPVAGKHPREPEVEAGLLLAGRSPAMKNAVLRRLFQLYGDKGAPWGPKPGPQVITFARDCSTHGGEEAETARMLLAL